MDVQKTGRLLLVLGVRDCMLVELRVEPSRRNKAMSGWWGKDTQDERSSRDKSGEVRKDGTCVEDSQ